MHWVACPVCGRKINLSLMPASGMYSSSENDPEEAKEAKHLLGAALREHLKLHSRPSEPTS